MTEYNPTQVRVWRYLCDSGDGIQLEPRFDSDGAPTTCQVNTAHGISGIPVIAYTIGQKEVIISTTTQGSNGYLEYYGIDQLDLPANATTDRRGEWPWDVYVISAGIDVSVNNVGDMLEMFTIPLSNSQKWDGYVGSLDQSVGAGVTVIPLPAAVIALMNPGFVLVLDQSPIGTLPTGAGGTANELGRIQSIDVANNQVTVDIGTTDAFPAGTQIKIRVKRITRMFFVNPGIRSLGEDVFGASFVPKGTQYLIRYTNQSATDTKNLYSYAVVKT